MHQHAWEEGNKMPLDTFKSGLSTVKRIGHVQIETPPYTLDGWLVLSKLVALTDVKQMYISTKSRSVA